MKKTEQELDDFLSEFIDSDENSELVGFLISTKISAAAVKLFDWRNKIIYKIARQDNLVLMYDPDEEEFGIAYLTAGEITNSELIGSLSYALQEMKKRSMQS